LLYELTQSKRICCHHTQSANVCVCTTLIFVYECTSRYVWEKSSSVIDVNTSPRLRQDPDGTLHISQTWSGDIGTYTCRVTSVGGNDSRNAHLRVRSAYLPYVCPVLSCRLYFFRLIYTLLGHDGWMFPPLLWFIAALLSNPSNPLIFTMQCSQFGCLMLLFAASLV